MKKDKAARKMVGKSSALARSGRGQRREKSGRCSGSEDRLFTERMAALGLAIREVPGDGNCMFRSIADQLGLGDKGGSKGHETVRASVIEYMRQHSDVFAAFVEDDEGFDAYLDRMSEDGEWGGHQELYAAAEVFSLRVVVHRAEGPRMVISCSASASSACEGRGADKEALRRGKTVRSIHLSYHGGSHYNSVRLVGDQGWGPAAAIPALDPQTSALPHIASNAGAETRNEHQSSSSSAHYWDDAYVDDDDDEGAGESVSGTAALTEQEQEGGGTADEDVVSRRLERLTVSSALPGGRIDWHAKREAHRAAVAERRGARALGCLSKKDQRRLLRGTSLEADVGATGKSGSPGSTTINTEEIHL